METGDRRLVLEEVLWKPREDTRGEKWNEFRNFWPLTDGPDGTHVRQTAGINPIGRVGTAGEPPRRPAIAVFLTPAGERNRLPWLDEVDLDSGFIRYFGDNRPSLHGPAEASAGNRELLSQMELYSADDPETRARAAPLLFFRNLGSGEGEPLTEFLGFGVIKAAHRLTQLYKKQTFTNYAYDCILFNGRETESGHEVLDMGWIDARRSSGKSSLDTLRLAPASWRRWVTSGLQVVDSPEIRRFVHRSPVWDFGDQLPVAESSLGRTLSEIYGHFGQDYKHGFQALAALVTMRVLAQPGQTYYRGWVTPIGPDGGVDFVQRTDLATGVSRTPLVILGQAKCKKPWSRGSGVKAEELARVVARLRRGWIGSFVTTSYFTDAAQREQAIDKYPLVLVPGIRVAETAEELRDELGLGNVKQLLAWVDQEYTKMLASSRPDPESIVREFPGRVPHKPDDTVPLLSS